MNLKTFILAGLLLISEVGFSEKLAMPSSFTDSWNKVLSSSEIEYNAKTWIRDLLDGKEVDTAHNWSTVDGVLPEKLTNLVDATYIIFTFNNSLYQTSFDRLIVLLSRPSFSNSKEWAALEVELSKSYLSTLSENAIVVGKDQEAMLAKMPWKGLLTGLKAFAALRDGKNASVAIKQFKTVTPWSFRLYLNAALYQARTEQLDEAIATLKDGYSKHSGEETAKNELALALGRLFYQKADLKSSEEWYSKVNTKSPQFINASEELLWVWLRTGKTDRLRGAANDLQNNFVKTNFMPETLVVKTISDLKLCQYDSAKKDFNDFVAINRDWAKKIDAAQKAENSEVPVNADWYSLYISKAIEARQKELAFGKTLSTESVAASVPAIGRQKHWDAVVQDLTVNVSRLERQKQAEYRRQWRNNGLMLKEAIRKMQFVKIEMASQAVTGAKANPESKTSVEEAAKSVSAIEKAGDEGWTFPEDNGDWPDERLSQRSTGASVCL